MNTKPAFGRGDFVEMDGLLAVVVGTYGDGTTPEGHLSVWFGDQQGVRSSQGGAGGSTPEVWTVPHPALSGCFDDNNQTLMLPELEQLTTDVGDSPRRTKP